jgi:hypothetical protein
VVQATDQVAERPGNLGGAPQVLRAPCGYRKRICEVFRPLPPKLQGPGGETGSRASSRGSRGTGVYSQQSQTRH